MTMFGVSWGFHLRDLSPLTKLVAIRLGDWCDVDARGSVDWEDLEDWCCTNRSDLTEALRLLAFNENVAWSVSDGGAITFTLPPQARPTPRRDSPPDTSISSIYIIKGRLGRKIGITSNLSNRVESLRVATLDDTVAVEWSAKAVTPVIRKAERFAHAALAAKLIRNEWFDVSLEEARVAVDAAIAQAQSRT